MNDELGSDPWESRPCPNCDGRLQEFMRNFDQTDLGLMHTETHWVCRDCGEEEIGKRLMVGVQNVR